MTYEEAVELGKEGHVWCSRCGKVLTARERTSARSTCSVARACRQRAIVGSGGRFPPLVSIPAVRGRRYCTVESRLERQKRLYLNEQLFDRVREEIASTIPVLETLARR